MYLVFYSIEVIFLFYLSKAFHKRLSFLVYKFFKKEKTAVWFIAILFLPGILVHEIAHFLSAVCLFVPVGNLEIVPSYHDKRIKLGSVSVGKSDPIRSFIISVAPFIAGNLIIYLLLNFISSAQVRISIYWMVPVFYFLIAVANTMFLSKRDFKGVWKLLIALGFFYIIVYLSGFTIPTGLVISALNFVSPILKTLCMFLLIPVVLDIFANIFLALLSGETFINLIFREKQ